MIKYIIQNKNNFLFYNDVYCTSLYIMYDTGIVLVIRFLISHCLFILKYRLSLSLNTIDTILMTYDDFSFILMWSFVQSEQSFVCYLRFCGVLDHINILREGRGVLDHIKISCKVLI